MKHGGYDLQEGHGGKAREGGKSGDTEVRVGSASAPGVSDLELAWKWTWLSVLSMGLLIFTIVPKKDGKYESGSRNEVAES